jgi:hypothetical protein
MKTKPTQTIALLLALLASPLATAADDHKHDHDHGKEEHHEHDEHVTQGPNGGHVIQSKAGFAFEVTVDKQRKARVLFLDKDLKPLPLGAQRISGIAGQRSAPTRLAFAKGKEKDADVLISDKALPAGAHVPMILTIHTTADAKAVVERFELHLH